MAHKLLPHPRRRMICKGGTPMKKAGEKHICPERKVNKKHLSSKTLLDKSPVIKRSI
jgi:hypothetical protein